jgi:hypothetical protein
MGAVGPVWTEIGAALGRFWEPWWEGFCQNGDGKISPQFFRVKKLKKSFFKKIS